MIVVMEKPAGSCKGILDYNFKKVKKEKAEMIAANKIFMPEKKEMVMYDMLIREKSPVRSSAKNFGLHLSVNPGIDEIPDDETAVSFITELMDEIGYGQQPYVIFKHYDIKRSHYHVVASRVTDKNQMMQSSYEHYKVFNALEKLQKKYQYTIGKNPETLSQRMENTMHFDKDNDNINEQVENIIHICHKYSFENMWQLQLLMLSMGIGIERDKKSQLRFYGVDKNGKKTTGLLSGVRQGLKYSLLLTLKKNEKASIKKETESVANDIWNATENCSKFQDFVNELAKIAITVITLKDEKNRPVGLEFIDHVDGLFYHSDELDLTEALLMKWGKEIDRFPANMPCFDVIGYLKKAETVENAETEKPKKKKNHGKDNTTITKKR